MADTSRRITLYINGTEVENSHKAITAAFRKEKAALDLMNRSAEGYEKQLEKVARLNGLMNQHKAELDGVNKKWTLMGSTVGQIAAGVLVGGGVMAAFTGLANLIPAMSENAATLSDEMADIAKTTGLSAEEVKRLNTELSKLNTRTSMSDRRSLAVVAGKLGKKTVDDVAGFVGAADKLIVALGEDLGGTDAVRVLGKLSEIFGEEKTYGTEKALLKIGSAINTLGSSSTANEGYIVQFAQRFGGLAKDVQMTTPQILGLAATFDQLGKTDELASSAIAKLLVDMGEQKGLAKYAKIAKMQMSDFAKLMKTDANEALLRVLEGARSTSGGIAGLTETLEKLGVTGVEQAQVLPALAAKIGLLREQQALASKAFADGTSVLDEFNVKNNNYAAKVEKLKNAVKQLAGAMLDKLQPALDESIERMSRWVGIDVLSKMEDEREAVAALVVELSEANTQEKRRLEILNELKDISPILVQGINAEATSVEQLWQNLERYNQAAEARQEIEKNNMKIAEISKQALEARKQQAEAETAIRRKMHGIMSKLDANAQAEAAKIMKNGSYSLVQQYMMMVKKFTIKSGTGIMFEKELAGSLLQAQKIIEAAKQRTQELMDANKALTGKIDAASWSRADSEEARERYEKQQAEKLQAEKTEATEAARQKFELALDNLRKRQDLAEVELRIAGATETAISDLLRKHIAQRINLYASYGRARSIDARREVLALQEMQRKTDQQTAQYEIQQAELAKQQVLEIARVKEEELTATYLRHARQRMELAQWYGDAAAAKNEAERIKQLEDTQFAEEGNKVRRRWELRKQFALIGVGELLKYDKMHLRQKFEQDAELFAEGSEEQKKLYENYLRELRALEESYETKYPFGMSPEAFENLRSKLLTAIDAASQLAQAMDTAAQISRNNVQSQIDLVERESDAKAEALERQLRTGIISQRKYDAQMQALDEKKERRNAELHRKQAEREKALALFQIAINTARAVAEALPRPEKVAFALAMGMLQAGVVSSQKIPEYAHGGWVEQDSLIRAGERGREWVASNTLVSDPYTGPIIGALDAIQRGWVAPSTPAAPIASPSTEQRQGSPQRMQVQVRAQVAPYELERYYSDTEALRALSRF